MDMGFIYPVCRSLNHRKLTIAREFFFIFVAPGRKHSPETAPFLMKKLLKTIYAALPFKRQIYSGIRAIWTPPESIYKHMHFKGVFSVPINESRSFQVNHFGLKIENDIFWNGLVGKWEKESLKLWVKLCENAQVVLDVGANTGIYALVAQTQNPEAKVHAFEPHPVFFKMLKQNVATNKFDIGAFDLAVSDVDGDVVIEDYTGQNDSMTVKSITLDTFVAQQNLARVDLVKVDVEMHELQVLRGFSECLRKYRPTLIIEVLTAELAHSIQGEVGDLGYVYFNIDEKGGVRQTPGIEKSDYFNYLICAPDVARKLGLHC
ncbi:MAG: FkbM family methyltransferase [Cryomorphaceae bacterium]|nr:MAG: FkbM family methyltransferase [Cryomorphaceae bacterium]